MRGIRRLDQIASPYLLDIRIVLVFPDGLTGYFNSLMEGKEGEG